MLISGLSRQASMWGIPMPYFMAVMALTVLPFIWFKLLWWPATGLLWYGLASGVTRINQSAHRVLLLLLIKTPRGLRIGKERRYGL